MFSDQIVRERARRYVCTWAWIIRRNFQRAPLLFLMAIGFGIGGRLGALLGFIVSIRCAVWILNPDAIPAGLINFLPLGGSSMVWFLVGVPGVIFLATAATQVLHHWTTLRLRTDMTNQFIIEKAELYIDMDSNRILTDKPAATQLGVDVRTGHSKLFAVHLLLINTIVLVSVLFICFMVGLVIDWFVMSATMSIGLVLALAFVGLRHTQSHEWTRTKESSQRSDQAALTSLVQEAVDPDEGAGAKQINVRKRLIDLTDSLSVSRQLDQRFAQDSALFTDIGQAVMVVVFLTLLIGRGGDPEHLGQLVILALLFRFALTYLQALAHTVIKLSPHYPFLVELRKTLKPDHHTTDRELT